MAAGIVYSTLLENLRNSDRGNPSRPKGKEWRKCGSGILRQAQDEKGGEGGGKRVRELNLP